MMDEYIEREKIWPALNAACVPYNRATQKAIESIPAADVRPVVRATWIVKEMQALFPGMGEHPILACSECGWQIYDLLDKVKERHHFCPNCGACMREG